WRRMPGQRVQLLDDVAAAEAIEAGIRREDVAEAWCIELDSAARKIKRGQRVKETWPSDTYRGNPRIIVVTDPRAQHLLEGTPIPERARRLLRGLPVASYPADPMNGIG